MTMIPKIYYIATMVCLIGLIGNAAGREVDADIWDKLGPFRAPKLSIEELRQMKDALYAIPDWENRLGDALARLALASRYSGSYDTIQKENAEFLAKRQSNTPLTPEEAQQWKEHVLRLQKEGRIRERTTDSRAEIYNIMHALSHTADERVIPLVAPILFEQIREIYEGDSRITVPQDEAAGALLNLSLRGVKMAGAPTGYNLNEWRKWWKENRGNYGPVPPALAALEATEGGTRPIPPAATPPPAPPATPTPKAAVPASTPESSISPAPKPVAEQISPRISPLWLIALPVILLLFALLARRRTS